MGKRVVMTSLLVAHLLSQTNGIKKNKSLESLMFEKSRVSVPETPKSVPAVCGVHHSRDLNLSHPINFQFLHFFTHG